MTENVNLTAAEWNVMECLWEKSPLPGRDIVDKLKTSVGWSKSTTLTMLSRMTAKEMIACEIQKVRMYTPCVNRDEAVRSETENFLKRVYKGSIGMMMNALTQKQELTPDDLDELYGILDEYKRKNTSGPCDNCKSD